MESYFTQDISLLTKFSDDLKKAKNIIVTSHQNPDGDAFGSGMGLTLFLKQISTAEITFISPTEYADFLDWMPGVSDALIYSAKLDQKIKSADMIFCCDFSALARLKDMEAPVKASEAIKIIIDHHEQPETFSNYIFWNQKASSTCELVFKLISELQYTELINIDIATALYTGLLTDTGSFKFNSTTAEVHKIAAFLLDKGVSPSEVHRSLFDRNSVSRLKMLGYVLNEKMVHLPEFRTIYIYLANEDLQKYKSQNGDTEGFVNYGLSVENVVMAAIFIEKDGIIKISFRSIHDFSVAELSRDHFQGGGHKNAAGGKSELNMQETIEKFLTLLPNYKEKLLVQPK
jgi:bifunctional oligoribonuclease and PAP phosphatase NrnA